MGSTFGQLREGIALHPRATTRISWSLLYLGIAASLVGVLGVLGPDFAQRVAAARAQGLRGRGPAARRSAS